MESKMNKRFGPKGQGTSLPPSPCTALEEGDDMSKGGGQSNQRSRQAWTMICFQYYFVPFQSRMVGFKVGSGSTQGIRFADEVTRAEPSLRPNLGWPPQGPSIERQLWPQAMFQAHGEQQHWKQMLQTSKQVQGLEMHPRLLSPKA